MPDVEILREAMEEEQRWTLASIEAVYGHIMANGDVERGEVGEHAAQKGNDCSSFTAK